MLIENVAVAPGAQGRGYGRRLLEHAEARGRRARGFGYDTAVHEPAVRGEHRAVSAHVGYRIDREEPFRDGFTTYMSKRVADP